MNVLPTMTSHHRRSGASARFIAALCACFRLVTHAAEPNPAATNAAPAPPLAATNNTGLTQSATQAAATNQPPNANHRSSAPTPPSTSTNAFDRYRLLAERNIFNANRTRASRATNGETKPAPKIEAFALAGVMSYQKGTFAFFDSTAAEFKKSLKTGDSIAGYQVHEITPGQVTLKNADQTFVLKPGQQLKREDGGAWQIVLSGDRLASSGTTGGTPSADADSAEPSGPASDILRKLMERRAKELNP